MPGPTRGTLRPRTLESLRENSSRDPVSSGRRSIAPPMNPQASSLREVRDAEASRRRFGRDPESFFTNSTVGDAGRGVLGSPATGIGGRARRLLGDFYRRAFHGPLASFLSAGGDIFRAYAESLATLSRDFVRAWARGAPGPLLMGLGFLLVDRDSFQSEHPLDRVREFEEGRPLQLEERYLPDSGALLYVHEGRAMLQSARAFGEIWIQEGADFRRLELGERRELAPGTLFFVGGRPEAAHRRGFDPKSTRAYRVEGPAAAGRWSVRELAHAEGKWEEFQVESLVRRLNLTEAEAREMTEDFHREIAASGWSEAQKAQFAGLDFLGEGWVKTFRMLGFKRLPVYDCLAELLRGLREASWTPEDAFFLLEGMARQGGLSPGGFDAEAVFHGLEAMRKLGLAAPEMLEWTLALAKSGAEFEAALHYFPKNLKLLTDHGLERAAAGAWLLDILAGLGESARVIKPENLLPFLRDAEFSPGQTRSLLRTLIDVLGEAARRDEQIRGAMEEIFGAEAGAHLVDASEFAKVWGNPAVFSYFVQVTAAFAKGLNSFGIPAETRLELMTAMIEAYREAVDKTFMDLMMPEYEGFFAEWRETLPELLEEMRQYTRKN